MTTTRSSTVIALVAFWGLMAARLAFSQPVSGEAAQAGFINSVGMKMVPIKPGTFRMGQEGARTSYTPPVTDVSDRGAAWDEMPVHEVTISRGFHMGATPVSNKQLAECFPGHGKPDLHNGVTLNADDAAVCVSWEEAAAYCEWLTKKEGKLYRLPTEAEWEYACRAGTTTPFNTGDTLPAGTIALGNYTAWIDFWFPNKAKTPPSYRYETPIVLKVASRSPNAWGLYDMHGLVEQWCADWYAPYTANTQTDPVGPSAGDFRVTRGGAHSLYAHMARSANRSGMLPWAKIVTIGFRVVTGDALNTAPQAAALPQLCQKDVSQTRAAWAPKTDMSKPSFRGPVPFVNVPKGSEGPMFARHNHFPGITALPNGDLLATWYSCVTEPGAELAILASRLRAGAAEWETASPFWDVPDRNDHGNGVWWDGDKTVYHFNGNYHIPGGFSSIVRYSTDNGATWSPAQQLTKQCVQVGHSVSRLHDGTLIVTADTITFGNDRCGIVIASTDNGKTWQDRSVVKGKTEFAPGKTGPGMVGVHSCAVELRDGRLMSINRLDGPDVQKAFRFKLGKSVSADGGRTWTYSEGPTPVISSSQRCRLIRLKEGPIMLVTFTEQMMKKDDFGRTVGSKKAEERAGLEFRDPTGKTFTGHGLMVALSYDEGETWPTKRLVTESKSEEGTLAGIDGRVFKYTPTEAEPVGYMSACVSPDGMIHLVSSKNYYTFNLAWIKEVEPK